jgi:hypothetical protein
MQGLRSRTLGIASTNATGGNQVEVFARQPGGTLTPAGTYDTAGMGPPSPRPCKPASSEVLIA